MIAFSFSPGGLCLPYHLGVIDALSHYGVINEKTPMCGSSAGAIAVASFAMGLPTLELLEHTIEISDRCAKEGGAQGRLLRHAEKLFREVTRPESFAKFQKRPGFTGIAYREVFPNPTKKYLQSSFENEEDLISAVLYSAMCPFFTTPHASMWGRGKMRGKLLVDGLFAAPRNRLGCVDLSLDPKLVGKVDRVVCVSVVPQHYWGFPDVDPSNCICPPPRQPLHHGDVSKTDETQMKRLFRLATKCSSREELTQLYREGFHDAEHWYHRYYEPEMKKLEGASKK